MDQKRNENENTKYAHKQTHTHTECETTTQKRKANVKGNDGYQMCVWQKQRGFFTVTRCA